MANGGIIGPVNTVTAASCVAAKVTSFTSSGNFTATKSQNVDYLVMAGGGGGGHDDGGGGGAGGYKSSGFGPSPLQGSAVPVIAGTPYVVTVGGGGNGAPNSPAAQATNGINSVFNYAGCATITSTGGGFGGRSPQAAGQPGGSGGGGGAGAGGGSASPSGQGQAGGAGTPGCNFAGGGGGVTQAGTAGSGSAPNPGVGGPGGDGAPNLITGSNVTYGGGGGGGAFGSSSPKGTGGAGGGGNAGSTPSGNGTPGTANTGGGGGGGSTSSSGRDGGNGGPGVVVIREPSYSELASAPGVWSMNTVYDFVKSDNWVSAPAFISASGGTRTEDGDYAIHTFTASGPFSVTAAVGKPAADSAADYLIVAGAGSSGNGNGNAPGGGGAGGVRASATTYSNGGPSAPRTACVSAVTLTSQDYAIVVGAGDVGSSGPQGNPGTRRGQDSSGLGLTATGGGAGGYHGGGGGPGNSGGSGGGASGGGLNKTAGAGNTPPTSPAQGMIGGARPGSAPDGGGGSGGGFIGAGTNAGPAIAAGGAGGGFPTAFGANGEPCGSFRYYAGGGASDGVTPGTTPAPAANVGGVGGGGGIGQADGSIGVAGTANTGGGGGGPNNTNYPIAGANGGSGIVVIRYKFQ